MSDQVRSFEQDVILPEINNDTIVIDDLNSWRWKAASALIQRFEEPAGRMPITSKSTMHTVNLVSELGRVFDPDRDNRVMLRDTLQNRDISDGDEDLPTLYDYFGADMSPRHPEVSGGDAIHHSSLAVPEPDRFISRLSNIAGVGRLLFIGNPKSLDAPRHISPGQSALGRFVEYDPDDNYKIEVAEKIEYILALTQNGAIDRLPHVNPSAQNIDVQADSAEWHFQDVDVSARNMSELIERTAMCSGDSEQEILMKQQLIKAYLTELHTKPLKEISTTVQRIEVAQATLSALFR